MANNLGSIYYTVNANTSKLLKAEAVINKSLSKSVEEFGKAEKAVTDFEAAQKKLGRTINQWGQVLNKNNKVVVSASEKYRKLASEAEALRNPLINQTKVSQGVSEGISGIGRNAGQAGIQLQQFIGQIQGGQSAMLALSQQGADLGFVLGAPLLGAVIGISASIASFLIPALTNSAKSTEDLQKAIERYTAIVTLAKDGNAEFTQSLQEIASRSRVVAKELSSIAAARALIAANDAAKTVKSEIKSFGSILGETFGSLSSKIGVTRQQLGALQGSIDALQRGVTIERIEAFEKQVSNIGRTGGKVSKETLDLKESLLTLADNMRLSIGVVDALRKGTDDFGNSVSVSKGKLDEMISSLAMQTATLGMSERELTLYIAKLNGATEADLAAIDALSRKKEKYDEEVEAQKARTQALKDYEAEMMRQLEAEERLRAAEQKRKDSRASTITQRVTTIAEGVDPLTQLQAERDRQLALVAEYEALETAQHQVAVDARAAIDADYNAKKAAAAEAAFVQQSTANQLIIDGLNSLGNTAGSVLTGMLTQTEGLKDSARNLANAIANDAVNSLVQMGIQYVKNRILGNALAASEKANIAGTTAAGVAAQQTATASTVAAAATTATAAAPAAALTSTFSFGSAALIGGAALLGTLAIAKSMGGGRLYGGNVNPGTMYPVNENGAPEMFTDGTRQYLMPNTRGEVISNKDATSAGGGLNVYNNIVNNTSSQVTSSSRVEGDGANRRLIIDTVVSDIRSGGPTRRAITDATTAKNRTL